MLYVGHCSEVFQISHFCYGIKVNVGNVQVCDYKSVILRMSKYRDILEVNYIFIKTKI
jgi:hypothetical protein